MAADIAMDESQGEKRTFTLFDKKEEFLVLQGKILAQRSWTDGENEGEDRETFSRIFMQISAIVSISCDVFDIVADIVSR